MPQLVVDEKGEIRHSDDIQDIITAPPSWLLRWGISLFFGVLVLIVSLSALIRYPDIVKTDLKITSTNVPKAIVSKVPGKLIRLLVNDNELVKEGQPIAYLESTAKHEDVIKLLKQLYTFQQQLVLGQSLIKIKSNISGTYTLGELQPAYQTFIQSLLTYWEAVSNGVWVKKRTFLMHDLQNLDKQQKQLQMQKSLQQHDLKLADEEYRMHQKLAQEKAETPAELREAQSRFIAKQSPLVQTDAAIITASGNHAAKQKEILELDNLMEEEKTKFQEALNNLISQAEDWKSKYILTSSQSGTLYFAGNIQTNQILQVEQEVFYINSGSGDFYGEIAVPQVNMGKVKEKQQVLIKLHSYPFEEYGVIRGTIESVSDVPYKDSVFLSKVAINQTNVTDLKKTVLLKQGMSADAEIITEDASILSRISRNLMKVISR